MSLPHKVIALGVVLSFVSGHSSAQNPTMKTVMQEKLVNTQRLLESVVVADYQGIGRSAEALSRISYTEMISWQASSRSEYVKQAMLFVRSVRGLQEAAAKRDIDLAAMEYTTLISSCVRCHMDVRRSKRVSVEQPVLHLGGLDNVVN
jgi:hypothetical protein